MFDVRCALSEVLHSMHVVNILYYSVTRSRTQTNELYIHTMTNRFLKETVTDEKLCKVQ